jgi:hypothetical protein
MKRHVKSIYNFPEHNFSGTSIIWAFINLDKGSLPLVRISEVLLYITHEIMSRSIRV